MTKEDWLDCVGPGWKNIVEPLVDQAEKEGVRIFDIKEKFGCLRFYTDGGVSEQFSKMIDEAEHLSEKTCECCGNPGKPRGGGWIKVSCDEHAKPNDFY